MSPEVIIPLLMFFWDNSNQLWGEIICQENLTYLWTFACLLALWSIEKWSKVIRDIVLHLLHDHVTFVCQSREEVISIIGDYLKSSTLCQKGKKSQSKSGKIKKLKQHFSHQKLNLAFALKLQRRWQTVQNALYLHPLPTGHCRA